MTIDKDAAKRLAIAYHGYCGADADNWQVWAKLLIKAQRDCDVELIPIATLLYDAPEPEPIAAPVDTWTRETELTEAEWRKPNGEGDGGALVPAPAPKPRKPSPGATVSLVAAQAARFYARNA